MSKFMRTVIPPTVIPPLPPMTVEQRANRIKWLRESANAPLTDAKTRRIYTDLADEIEEGK